MTIAERFRKRVPGAWLNPYLDEKLEADLVNKAVAFYDAGNERLFLFQDGSALCDKCGTAFPPKAGHKKYRKPRSK
jgi:hypothetical protein